MKKKRSLTQEKIKQKALELFNTHNALQVTTNHIAKELSISPGNLYYHFKNKEAIILALYEDLSLEFETLKSFTVIQNAHNPLQALDEMYDRYGELFYKYRFLLRDIGVLQATYPRLKELFLQRQERRLRQIEGVFSYLLEQGIISIEPTQIPLRAKLNWFISSFWQSFVSLDQEVSPLSIKEGKKIIFEILLQPVLTQKGRELYEKI